jgi:hypothetical protein
MCNLIVRNNDFFGIPNKLKRSIKATMNSFTYRVKIGLMMPDGFVLISLKIAEFRTPTPKDVRTKGSKIL